MRRQDLRREEVLGGLEDRTRRKKDWKMKLKEDKTRRSNDKERD